MDLELLTIPGCPHAGQARELFRAALDLEGIKDPFTVREIGTEEEAAALVFHGSPTFSINGTDLFPSNAEPAVTCRVYPTPEGLRGQPALEALRQAIRASLSTARQHALQSPGGTVNPDRVTTVAEYLRACRELNSWLENATPSDLRRRSNGTRWTNEELLFHMVFGYMIVRALLPLVRVISRLPRSWGRRFAAALNAGTGPFDWVNYWGARAAATVYNRHRMSRKLQKTITALARRLERETPDSLARSMPFPTRWDPFFTTEMTLAEVYAYATQHFDFHAKQLSLSRSDTQPST